MKNTFSIPETLWSTALLVRSAEQHLLKLFDQGKINGTIHTCIGQELVGATIAEYAYLKGDFIVSNHRGHGHFLSCFPNLLSEFFAELTSKQSAICGGHGGSQHLYIDGFLSNGILGSTAPIACGIAYAKKQKKHNNIVTLFLGDGAFGEGVIYEAMNLAQVYKLPLYIICESNNISQSTVTSTVQTGSLTRRAEGFGLAIFESSTNELEKHIETTKEAASLVRTNTPVFHLVHTQRLHSHSKGDDTRSEKELKALWRKDPLNNWLNSLTPKNKQRIEEEITNQIKASFEHSEQLPVASISYFTNDIHLKKPSIHPITNPQELLKKRINKTLDNLLKSNINCVIFGEDIESPYGGAFKITEGLSTRYPEQVWNTPISESAITGKAIGMAMSGFSPIVEIMFADFLTLTFDQLLNSASKFSALFKLNGSLPLVIRTPTGGRRGYGATHSQSPEKHFLGIPNLNVFAINYLLSEDALKGIYSVNKPTLILENKSDYAKPVEPLIGFERFYCRHSKTIIIKPKCTAKITLLCYGGMLSHAEKAASHLLFEHEIAAEIICPSQLYPFDDVLLAKSLNQTSKLLCVEEGTDFANFSSQCIAQLHSKGIEFTSNAISADDSVISSALNIELDQLPNRDKIIYTVLNWNH
ncbi:alpha-ketoacid dehydrogenase subunit alpha/beta [Pseudoalteromonas sp. MB47]|uniref:dehydrogenase E1 component subunit alpha/beta n=1 Tax=Pseudoalteromonas sp. MB47 TaxID=2588452 RepID=UPI00140A17F2|nr:alpha-ketoacid dehydrogenase subunit alpha/beta [Pseudoalteromonas sp. MB47]NHH91306.1 2-oxoisovalerate dehydrogenase subunit beta [Pseudoalteromonas sp. MB47]